MRFGISPMTYELLIDGILAKKGLEGISEFQFSDLVKRAAESGYQHFEIELDLFQVFPITIDNQQIRILQALKNEYGITYSAHLPFLSLDLGGPNEFVRKGSVNAIIHAYNSIVELKDDIDVFVLHPTGETVASVINFIENPQIQNITAELFSANAIQSIERFIEDTNINRNKIAIENIQFPFDATIEIIKKLKTKLCIDTAHFLGGFSGDYDLLEITKKYLDITAEIHLQDYDDENLFSDHSALGTGKSFPTEFLNIIHQKNFDGPVVFELTKDETIKSIEYIKENAPQIKLPDIKDQPFY
ncbi:MAG: sugar phosphate isomerase/epimerase [Candidatus Lokiarchaeota archaeon]|nr:sugar phosphate isomerase/epimerase [Candidatus Lokiarchaeota archaeon]